MKIIKNKNKNKTKQKQKTLTHPLIPVYVRALPEKKIGKKWKNKEKMKQILGKNETTWTWWKWRKIEGNVLSSKPRRVRPCILPFLSRNVKCGASKQLICKTKRWFLQMQPRWPAMTRVSCQSALNRQLLTGGVTLSYSTNILWHTKIYFECALGRTIRFPRGYEFFRFFFHLFS